jgi:glycosyltransferase involved in cell wall biosynthesis
MELDISVIIPSNNSHQQLFRIVQAVCDQTVKPTEIVIVDSSLNDASETPVIVALCKSNNIKLIYEQRELTMPGRARNIGLDLSSGQLIAFIDVQTIPRKIWIEASLSLLEGHDVAGVWGATYFNGVTKFEGLMRDGFYGAHPQRTLPGSIFKRFVFEKTGQFIEWVRAGEDTEWMMRALVLRLTIVSSSVILIDYVGLIGLDINQLLKKWHRNYSASRDLPQFFPYKMLLWLVLYPLFILIAFNWNHLIADWRIDSPLYIGHVTKLAAILPALTYTVVRGIFLPLRRGVDIRNLVPIRFLAIISICLAADLMRALVYTLPRFKGIAANAKIIK